MNDCLRLIAPLKPPFEPIDLVWEVDSKTTFSNNWIKVTEVAKRENETAVRAQRPGVVVDLVFSSRIGTGSLSIKGGDFQGTWNLMTVTAVDGKSKFQELLYMKAVNAKGRAVELLLGRGRTTQTAKT